MTIDWTGLLLGLLIGVVVYTLVGLLVYIACGVGTDRARLWTSIAWPIVLLAMLAFICFALIDMPSRWLADKFDKFLSYVFDKHAH